MRGVIGSTRSLFFFFFSSRRRHTRLQGDWSSDVCSSDPSRRRHTNYKVTGVQTCALPIDRKSTRLNSSHLVISYAVFCLDRKSKRLNSSQLLISYAVFCLKKKRTSHT